MCPLVSFAAEMHVTIMHCEPYTTLHNVNECVFLSNVLGHWRMRVYVCCVFFCDCTRLCQQNCSMYIKILVVRKMTVSVRCKRGQF